MESEKNNNIFSRMELNVKHKQNQRYDSIESSEFLDEKWKHNNMQSRELISLPFDSWSAQLNPLKFKKNVWQTHYSYRSTQIKKVHVNPKPYGNFSSLVSIMS